MSKEWSNMRNWVNDNSTSSVIGLIVIDKKHCTRFGYCSSVENHVYFLEEHLARCTRNGDFASAGDSAFCIVQFQIKLWQAAFMGHFVGFLSLALVSFYGRLVFKADLYVHLCNTIGNSQSIFWPRGERSKQCYWENFNSVVIVAAAMHTTACNVCLKLGRNWFGVQPLLLLIL